MNLRSAFCQLDDKQDYASMLNLANALDQSNNPLLADIITRYALQANSRMITAAQMPGAQPSVILNGPLKKAFEITIQNITGYPFSLHNIPNVKNIQNIMQDERTWAIFKTVAANELNTNDLSKEAIRSRIRRAWAAFKKYIANNQGQLSVETDEYANLVGKKVKNDLDAMKIASSIIERVLNRHHITHQVGEYFDPHSPVFYEVFSPQSKLMLEVVHDLTEDLSADEAHHILAMVQANIASNGYNSEDMHKAVKQYKKNVQNREYGIHNGDDLKLIYAGIQKTMPGVNPKDVFNPASEAHWEFFDAWNLTSLEQNIHQMLLEQGYDDIHAQATAQRLTDGVKSIHADNMRKNPNYKNHQEQYLLNKKQKQELQKQKQVSEEEYQDKLQKFIEYQNANQGLQRKDVERMLTLHDQVEENRPQSPDKKPWWQFWKKD